MYIVYGISFNNTGMDCVFLSLIMLFVQSCHMYGPFKGESWSFVGVPGSERGGRGPSMSHQSLPPASNEVHLHVL